MKKTDARFMLAKAKRTSLEDAFLKMIQVSGLPPPVREYKFCERRWRFDFAWPVRRVAVECEGGIWVGGAHTRGKHFESDCRKYNWAAMRYWRVLRFTRSMIESFEAAKLLSSTLLGLFDEEDN